MGSLLEKNVGYGQGPIAWPYIWLHNYIRY